MSWVHPGLALTLSWVVAILHVRPCASRGRAVRRARQCECLVSLRAVIICQAAACHYTTPVDIVALFSNWDLLHLLQARRWVDLDRWQVCNPLCLSSVAVLQLHQSAVALLLPYRLNETSQADKSSYAQGTRDEHKNEWQYNPASP